MKTKMKKAQKRADRVADRLLTNGAWDWSYGRDLTYEESRIRVIAAYLSGWKSAMRAVAKHPESEHLSIDDLDEL